MACFSALPTAGRTVDATAMVEDATQVTATVADPKSRAVAKARNLFDVI
jgi:hypothetical protein